VLIQSRRRTTVLEWRLLRAAVLTVIVTAPPNSPLWTAAVRLFCHADPDFAAQLTAALVDRLLRDALYELAAGRVLGDLDAALRGDEPTPRLDRLARRIARRWRLQSPHTVALAHLARDKHFLRERVDWPIPAVVLDQGDRAAAKHQVVRNALVDFQWGEKPEVKCETAPRWTSLSRLSWLTNGVLALAKRRLERLAADPRETSIDGPEARDVLLESGLDALHAVEAQAAAIEKLNWLCEYLGKRLTDRQVEYLALWDPWGDPRTNREVSAGLGIRDPAGSRLRSRIEKVLETAKAAANAM
jgi:hypothetical protein